MRSARLLLALAFAASPFVAWACGGPAFRIGTVPDATADASTTSDGASTIDGGAEASSEGGACSKGKGPDQTLVPVSAPFCIDGTEVTRAQYFEFQSNHGAIPFPPQCSAKSGNVTSIQPPTGAESNQPVARVDWCDAWAYCNWAGKRLCGLPGGGSARLQLDRTASGFVVSRASISGSQWHIACSANGTLAYPYGQSFDARACVSNGAGPAAVKSKAACQGGYPGIYDLSGNVEEWVDFCITNDGGPPLGTDAGFQIGGTYCLAPAGAFNDNDNPANFACDMVFLPPITSLREDVGFRCCSK
jgi:formylglycine-generating enzyme required for sulfatase activity